MRMQYNKIRGSSKTRGFTLIELGIVVAVIALLASGVMAGQGFIRTTKVNRAVQSIQNVRKAVNAYVAGRGGPDNISSWATEDLSLLEQLQQRHLLNDINIEEFIKDLKPGASLESSDAFGEYYYITFIHLDATTMLDLRVAFEDDPFVDNTTMGCNLGNSEEWGMAMCFKYNL